MFKLNYLFILFLMVLQLISVKSLADNYTKKSLADNYTNVMQLNFQKKRSNYQIISFFNVKDNSLPLSSQLINLYHYQPKDYLMLNYSSILNPKFWSPLIKQQSTDRNKIIIFLKKLHDTGKLTWKKEWYFGNYIWLIISILIIPLGYFYSDKLFAWISFHKISQEHLRHSFFTVTLMMSTVIIVVITFNFIALIFNSRNETTGDIRDFIDRLAQLSIYCGLMAGLGRIFLLPYRPICCLRNASKKMIFFLKSLIPIITIIVFIIQIVESFNYSVNTSLSITIFLNGIIALFISITGLIISLIIKRTRQKISNTKKKHQNSTILYFIQIAMTINCIVILISLIIGYITLSLFLSYKMIWCIILFGLYWLFSHFIDDICESLCLNKTPFISRIKKSFNLNNQNSQQASILLSAVGKVFLVFFLVLLLFNGTFALSTPIDFIYKIIEFWNGKGLETLNIVPAHMFHALLFMIIGVYILRSVNYWLENNFFPKTNMDIGIQVSLLTLFRNIGYVVIILLTLSIIGLQWNKLAWIVSALSVGIGFGLQEIVKNFISGLILLTERPVKVGDLVSINGIEGDIRRINVRATEIQLHDKSTLIVPNSQLISQNVRNATMDCAQGVVTITLTFPLDIDPIKVREILLHVYKKSDRILLKPEPSVFFKELMPNGIVLSITGNVFNQRHISSTKSDLLFNILLYLRKENIKLSAPQTIIIEN